MRPQRSTSGFAALMALAVILLAGPGWAQVEPGRWLKLNMLWRVHPSATDLMTTNALGEQQLFSSDGQMFYVPRQTLSGTAPLYRLLNHPWQTDHMDSPAWGEGGYTVEGVLGYPWTSSSAVAGLSGILRCVQNQTTNDHGILRSGETPPDYYISEGPLGVYGYRRYGNQQELLLTASAAGLQIASNLIAGGAVWMWDWNGVQFVNDYDYGRQIQSAMFPMTGIGPNSYTWQNPNEAGSYVSDPGTSAQNKQGSPIVSYGNSYGQWGAVTQSTRAVPLDYDPRKWTPPPPTENWAEVPIVWSDIQIGKNLTLNWSPYPGVNFNWPVARYETTIDFAPGVPTMTEAVVEAPTGYLRGVFRYFYEYDFSRPAGQRLMPITSWDVCEGSPCRGFLPGAKTPGDNRLAIIIADGSGLSANAMGVYVNNGNTGLTLLDVTSGGDNGQFGNSFAKWGARYHSSVAPGFRLSTWIATGTVQNVQGYLDQLWSWNLVSK